MYLSYVSFDSLTRDIVYVVLSYFVLEDHLLDNCTFHMHAIFHSSKFVAILCHCIFMMISTIYSILFVISDSVFKISVMSCNFTDIIIHD